MKGLKLPSGIQKDPLWVNIFKVLRVICSFICRFHQKNITALAGQQKKLMLWKYCSDKRVFVIFLQLLSSMAECLCVDVQSLGVWRQLYTKHLPQSRWGSRFLQTTTRRNYKLWRLILCSLQSAVEPFTELVEDSAAEGLTLDARYEDTYTRLAFVYGVLWKLCCAFYLQLRKNLEETIQSFRVTNDEMRDTNETRDLQECNSLCQVSSRTCTVFDLSLFITSKTHLWFYSVLDLNIVSLSVKL